LKSERRDYNRHISRFRFLTSDSEDFRLRL
jgi:hypothetical protein